MEREAGRGRRWALEVVVNERLYRASCCCSLLKNEEQKQQQGHGDVEDGAREGSGDRVGGNRLERADPGAGRWIRPVLGKIEARDAARSRGRRGRLKFL